jgi:hypothetical protein
MPVSSYVLIEKNSSFDMSSSEKDGEIPSSEARSRWHLSEKWKHDADAWDPTYHLSWTYAEPGYLVSARSFPLIYRVSFEPS